MICVVCLFWLGEFVLLLLRGCSLISKWPRDARNMCCRLRLTSISLIDVCETCMNLFLDIFCLKKCERRELFIKFLLTTMTTNDCASVSFNFCLGNSPRNKKWKLFGSIRLAAKLEVKRKVNNRLHTLTRHRKASPIDYTTLKAI